MSSLLCRSRFPKLCLLLFSRMLCCSFHALLLVPGLFLNRCSSTVGAEVYTGIFAYSGDMIAYMGEPFYYENFTCMLGDEEETLNAGIGFVYYTNTTKQTLVSYGVDRLGVSHTSLMVLAAMG